MVVAAPPTYLLRLLAAGVILTLFRFTYIKLYPHDLPLDTPAVPHVHVPIAKPVLEDYKEPVVAIAPESCSPEAWNTGKWTLRDPPRSNKTAPTSLADIFEYEGFEGCTSDREYLWHFSGDESEWHRFPEVAAYEWTPSPECRPRKFDREGLVRDLVEKGGWLLIGDSVTENHYYSLSCLLFPHVRTTPNFTAFGYYEHHWPQEMYLHPDSPLVQNIQFPEGFDIATTPLVSFRRSDLLLTKDQLKDLHAAIYPDRAARENFSLFSGELIIDEPPLAYLPLFTAPLPRANYGTLIVNTAGHWTRHTLTGLRDEALPFDGIGNLLEFFEESMSVWSGLVQAWLRRVDELQDAEAREYGGGSVTMGGRRRQVIARSYLPGHDNCHSFAHPWRTYEQEGMPLPWNWRWMHTFNDLFKRVLANSRYPNIHFLGIEYPGTLRADAHVSTDCLHLMAGSGVMEGWTQYIWHYITREIEQ